MELKLNFLLIPMESGGIWITNQKGIGSQKNSDDDWDYSDDESESEREMSACNDGTSDDEDSDDSRGPKPKNKGPTFWEMQRRKHERHPDARRIEEAGGSLLPKGSNWGERRGLAGKAVVSTNRVGMSNFAKLRAALIASNTTVS